jgi:hypothetical protein
MKKLFLLLCCLVLLIVSGCGAKSDLKLSDGQPTIKLTKENGVTQIRFKDTLSVDQLKTLDGKKVSITGFMSTISPLNGEYIYLINMPYQSCPFCKPNTKQLVNTMAIYAKKGDTFPFTDVPVKMTGTLQIGQFTDVVGYTYPVQLIDATYTKADVSSLEADIKIYTALIDKGFALTFTDTLAKVYDVVKYKDVGKTEADLKPVGVKEIKDLREMFFGLDKANYTEAIAALDRLDRLVTNVNQTVADKEYANLTIYREEGATIYQQFLAWVVKPQI